MRYRPSSLVMSLLLCCLLWGLGLSFSNSELRAYQSHHKKDEWAQIVKLHDRGWALIERGDFESAQKLFKAATGKLKRYRVNSFLRATFWLGYSSELADNYEEAKHFYEECRPHPLLNSPEAVVDRRSISQQVNERLEIVNRHLHLSQKASDRTFPRISVKGGSKGGKEDLPPRSSDLRL